MRSLYNRDYRDKPPHMLTFKPQDPEETHTDMGRACKQQTYESAPYAGRLVLVDEICRLLLRKANECLANINVSCVDGPSN